MTKMKLYFAPHTCALASHIALEQAGADYETVRVDFKTNAQRTPEYMKINPKARVPALVTDRGILTETPAILAFVAQRFPQAGLAPLSFNALLNNAAGLHSANMAARGTMEHTLYGTTLPTAESRLDYVGYDFSDRAENVAFGYTSEETTWDE